MTKFMAVTFCVFLVSGTIIAGSSSGGSIHDSLSATLSAHSGTRDVIAYIDTTEIGMLPVNNVAVPPGIHTVTFRRAGENSWIASVVAETLMFAAGEDVERDVIFPKIYHVTSDPYGANIFLNDSLVGQTPAVLELDRSNGILTMTKEGYESASLSLSGGEQQLVHATLMPNSGIAPSALVSEEQMKSLTPVVLTSGAAILAGTAAAYFKIKADGYYNDYRQNGDEGALDRTRRYDTISGVALVTSSASLLLLSYFLLSR
ncbi:MAG TPA: PEGA domain-containing protein [Bacteroidota bacterium]|jgi:hypothetical protein|nr:PEGA domain-containing protein [Bacteroidota bacterium]